MTDLTTLETLIARNNELLMHIYASQLIVIGVTGACLVIYLLYRFLKKFF